VLESQLLEEEETKEPWKREKVFKKRTNGHRRTFLGIIGKRGTTRLI